MYQSYHLDHNAPRAIDRAALSDDPATPSPAGPPVTRVTRESLAENFNREIEAWARQALGANGFGDCP